MAKRKMVKNENIEAISEIENNEITDVKEETVVEKEDITESSKMEAEEVVTEKVDNAVKVVKEETLVKKTTKNNKKPIMFGYIWNGQEYD